MLVGSSVRPLAVSVQPFFSHETPETKKPGKLGSKDKTYWRFCFQFSKLLTVSDLVRHHCLGAWCVVRL